MTIKAQFITILLCCYTITTYGQEIIPFQLGEDNRIYIKGKINQSDTLDLVFDLGANITVISKLPQCKHTRHL